MYTATELIRMINEGKLKERLSDIYGMDIEYQTKRYLAAVQGFVDAFGDREVSIFSAPGRTEVGGNHTDHQHGQVLAAAVNLDVIAVTTKTEDELIQIHSAGYEPALVSTRALEPEERETGTSVSLIRGVTAGFVEHGYKVGGMKAYMTSDVLGGSGLSSSAAYEVAVGNMLSGLYNDMKVDAVTIAVIAQYAENKYFGKPCGLMDQMACSVGGLINIDFDIPKEPEIRKLSADFTSFGHKLCIVDVKASHADLTDEYAAVPDEMKKVAAFFGKEVLRDVDEAEVIGNIPELNKKFGGRSVVRALHFFEEHKRVGYEVEALEAGDFEGFKKWVKESGNSSFKFLQNVYPSSQPKLQNMSIALALSELILKDRGVSRVHGGGFAGTIQAFVPEDMVEAYRESIDRVFGENSCHVLQVRRYGGMMVI